MRVNKEIYTFYYATYYFFILSPINSNMMKLDTCNCRYAVPISNTTCECNGPATSWKFKFNVRCVGWCIFGVNGVEIAKESTRIPHNNSTFGVSCPPGKKVPKSSVVSFAFTALDYGFINFGPLMK